MLIPRLKNYMEKKWKYTKLSYVHWNWGKLNFCFLDNGLICQWLESINKIVIFFQMSNQIDMNEQSALMAQFEDGLWDRWQPSQNYITGTRASQTSWHLWCTIAAGLTGFKIVIETGYKVRFKQNFLKNKKHHVHASLVWLFEGNFKNC